MPASNSTVFPFSGLASSARHASGMRLRSSGAIHCDHIASGALPNIAPPSSRCELPITDQSFIRYSSAMDRRAFGRLADAFPAAVAAGLDGTEVAAPEHHL